MPYRNLLVLRGPIFCPSQCLFYLFRKLYHVPLCSRLPLTFSSISASVTEFLLKPLIHLDFIFVQGDRYESFAFFYMLISICASINVVEYALFYALHIFCQNSKVIVVWIYIRVFDSIPLMHVPIFCANIILFLLL